MPLLKTLSLEKNLCFQNVKIMNQSKKVKQILPRLINLQLKYKKMGYNTKMKMMFFSSFDSNINRLHKQINFC